MDVDHRDYYVAIAMELLLTLFAMLSAVTGAFTGVPEPEAQLQRAESAASAQAVFEVAEEVALPIVAAIPADDPPSTEVAALPSFSLAAAFPLYADRLIE